MTKRECPATDTIDRAPKGRRERLKRAVYEHKALHALVGPFYHVLTRSKGFDSTQYWEKRYQLGGNSGAGSYGRLAEYKASFLNDFVQKNGVASVIEFGSGDGAQLRLFRFKTYIGLDVSRTSLKMCIEQYGKDKSKSFYLYDPGCTQDNHHLFEAELSLSLDVIYHLVEDATYSHYMHFLFAAARRFVIIYASNTEVNRRTQAQHVRHRRFTDWVAEHEPDWVLIERAVNAYGLETNNELDQSFADFYVYRRRDLLRLDQV